MYIKNNGLLPKLKMVFYKTRINNFKRELVILFNNLVKILIKMGMEMYMWYKEKYLKN
jgi:hypothetical protein